MKEDHPPLPLPKQFAMLRLCTVIVIGVLICFVSIMLWSIVTHVNTTLSQTDIIALTTTVTAPLESIDFDRFDAVHMNWQQKKELPIILLENNPFQAPTASSSPVSSYLSDTTVSL